MFVFGIFIMTRPKPFAGNFLPLIICTLHFIGLMYVNILVTVNTWYFDTLYSCEVLTWGVVGWSVFPLCPLRSQLLYCQNCMHHH